VIRESVSGNLVNTPNLGYDKYILICIQVVQNRTIDFPRECVQIEFRYSSFCVQVDVLNLLAKDGIRTSPSKVVGVIGSTLDCQGDIRHASIPKIRIRRLLQEFFNNIMANGRIKFVGANAQELPGVLEKGFELSLRDDFMEYFPLIFVGYSCKRIVKQCLRSKREQYTACTGPVRSHSSYCFCDTGPVQVLATTLKWIVPEGRERFFSRGRPGGSSKG
jgi:hypothetical protein